MVVRSLLTVLGYQADDKALNNYANALKKIINFVKVAAVATAALGTAVLKLGGDMEQTEIAFETMLRSGEKADKLIKEITNFAAKTPFELSGLIQSSKQLLAFKFGAEEIIPTMRNLGNIAAGVGRDKLPTLVRALGKIRVKGKATMEELNMLLEAGVPILDQLSENFGVSSEELFKMISKGKVAYGDVNKALEDLSTGNGMFANLMEKQSKSFLGIISNIGDFFTNLGVSIGKEILPAAKELARYFLQFLESNKDVIKAGLVKFFKALLHGITFVVIFIKELIDRMGGLESIGKTIGDIFGFIGGVFMFFVKIVMQIIKFLYPFRYIILGIIAAIKAWSIIQGILNAIMAANPITLIIIAIGILIVLIVLLIKNWDKVKEVLVAGWNNIINFLSNVWKKIVEIFMNAWNAIVDFFNFIGKNIAAIAVKVWTGIINFFKNAWNGILGVFMKIGGSISSFLSGLWNNITTGVGSAWNGIINFFKNAWDGIISILAKAGAVFLSAITGIWNTAIGGIDAVWSGVANFFEGVWKNITSVLDNVSSKFIEAWNFIVSFLKKAQKKISSILQAAWGGIVNGLISAWSGVTEFFKGLWDMITSGIVQAQQGIVRSFKGIWNKIVGGFLDAWNKAIEFITRVKDEIAGKLTGAWSGISTFFSGLWEGIVNGFLSAWKAITKIMEIPGKIIEWLKKKWEDIGSFFGTLWDDIVGNIKKAWDGLLGDIQKLWDDFMKFIQPVIDTVTGVFETFFGGPSPEMAAAGAAGTVIGTRTNSTSVNTTVNMNLPAGTPEETARAAKEQGRKAVEEAWNSILKEGTINNPGGG